MDGARHLMTAPAVSAVVATLGRDCLEACLAALRESSVPFTDLIVVHQGDDPAVRTRAERHGARYVRLDRRGLSRARNAGIAEAHGDWVFFPDDDCVPDPRFVVEVTRAIESTPGLQFVCGRVHDPDGTVLAPAMGEAPGALRSLRGVMRGVVSAGLVVSRRALDAVGGFDPRLGAGAEFPSGEESDLVFRLLRRGGRGAYVPGARVLHAEPFASRTPGERTERAYDYGRGWGALFAKHGVRGARPAALALHAEYLARAAGGMLLAGFAGRPGDASRYAASFRGRWRGFFDFLRVPEPPPC